MSKTHFIFPIDYNGLLSIVNFVGKIRTRHKTKTYYNCLCKCGKSVKIELGALKRGQKSCGCIMKKYDKCDSEKIKSEYLSGTIIKQIAENHKVSIDTISKILNINGIKTSTIKNRVGHKYGNLVVIERDFLDKKRIYWKCLCVCGKIKSVCSNDLNKTNSCGCLRNFDKREGFKEISGQYFGSIKYMAIKRGLEFKIDAQFIWELFEKQQRKCQLSGQELILTRKNRTASLDRINSKKGYLKTNVRWVHKNINLSKKDMNDKYFINICRLVSNNVIGTSFPVNKELYKKIEYDYKVPLKMGKNNAGWKGYMDISGTYLKKMRNNAKARNLEFSIDGKYIWKIFLKQKKICPFTGIELCFSPHYKTHTNQTASVDRIDNLKGYIKKNIRIVDKTINVMRWGVSEKDFIDSCLAVANYRGSNE